MSRERALQRRLRTLETLTEAVGALRALSAQHFRVARELLPAARAYRDEISAALAVLPRSPGDGERATPAPPGVVLIAADLGLVGEYTPRLVREVLDLREEVGEGPLVCLGHRARAPLERAGVEPHRVHSAPTSVANIPAFLIPLVEEILALQRAGGLEALWLVAARFEGAGHFRAARVPVLPVVAPPTATPLAASPYSEAAHLRGVVVREYLYAALYETVLEALASEHGKRLLTAESARTWLDERSTAIRRRASAIRRETSTQEVLEVVTAARAARGGDGAETW